MKRNLRLTVILFFAVFTAGAADQTVSIDGLTKADAITAVVQAAIDAAEGRGTVTVTGTATVNLLSENGKAVTLNMSAGVTVLWKASLSGSSHDDALIEITGGTFEVTTGGFVATNSAGKYAFTTTGDAIISGGGVGKIILTGESSTITVSSGTVSTINASGAKSTTLICSTGKVSPPSNTTAIYSVGNVEVRDDATVTRTGTYTGVAISAASVTVSGGTVSAVDAQAISSSNGSVIISGGSVIALNQAISAKTVIVSGNGKIKAGKKGGTSYTGAAIRASEKVEIKDNAEIIAESVVAIAAPTVNVSGGIVTTAENSSTHKTIEATSSSGKVTISGGTISSRNVAIFGSGAVTICGTAKVKGGLYGNYQAVNTSGNVEIKDDAEISAIYATGSTITVSGGTITGSWPVSSSTSSNTNVIVSGGTITTTSSNGYAIDVSGNVTVSGGKVSATTGRAISGKNVTISGGMVCATFGYAISVTDANSKIIINGGVVFAYKPVMLLKSVNNFTGVSGTGVLIGWDQAAGNTSYVKGTSTDLEALPVDCAKWDKVSDSGGIAYENGANRGFIPLENITVKGANAIGSVDPDKGIFLYPNPVKDELYVKSSMPVQQVVIYNLSGNIVLQQKNVDDKIDVSALPKGVYLLIVTTADGEVVRKIVKE